MGGGDGIDEEIHERELEEASKASTSFDQWEEHPMEDQISKPNPPPYGYDGSQGLSKSFRITIVTGSVLIMVAVILALSVFLPRSADSSKKKSSNDRKLIEIDELEFRDIVCGATQFQQVCKSSPSTKKQRDFLAGPYDALMASVEGGISPNLTVSMDGSSRYSSIQEAVDGAPEGISNQRFVIHVKAGVYDEVLRIPRNKFNIMIVGDGADRTVVSSRGPATVGVDGHGFSARDITFENREEKIRGVALRVDGDLCVFQNCAVDGHGGALYSHALRQFYRESRIDGITDLIFGNAAGVFRNCSIFVRPRRDSTPGRRETDRGTGFVFRNCTLR